MAGQLLETGVSAEEMLCAVEGACAGGHIDVVRLMLSSRVGNLVSLFGFLYSLYTPKGYNL